MIDPVNQILRDLIQSRIPALVGPTQVGFEPPNDEWRQNLVSAHEERVNLYLYEVRENLKLRTNERTRIPENGWYRESKAPARLDCHYLMTAWSPVTFMSPAVEPTRDEHVLLYAVLDMLMRNRPLEPATVYRPGFQIPSGRTLQSVPLVLREEQLPLEAALPDGLRNPGDFWSTMKVVWKPSIELVVTVPILLAQEDIESPMVTSLIGEYMQGQDATTIEGLLSIGGQVLDGTGTAVAGAWVQITGLAPPELQAVNRRTVAQRDGQFVFSRLRPGQYHLRTVAASMGDIGRDVELPSTTGEYDLHFP